MIARGMSSLMKFDDVQSFQFLNFCIYFVSVVHWNQVWSDLDRNVRCQLDIFNCFGLPWDVRKYGSKFL